MVDVAFDAVKLVVNYIREEARLQGRAGDDVRFIMDEMESMNNLLHQLVSTTNPSHDPAGGGDYSHLRTWMKQLLELAFDSKNSVELYMQSAGDSHCCRLPWAMVARHRVVSRIRELKERAREISERQVRYGGGGLLPAQRRDGDAEGGAVDLRAVSSQRQRPRGHASSSSLVRRAIFDREFVDNSSVDEALLRLNFLRLKKKKKGADQQSQQQQVVSDDDDDGNGSGGDDESTDDDLGSGDKQQQQQQSDAGDKQQKQQQSDAGDKQQQQQSDAGDKQQQQSDAGDKQQQQPTQLEAGDKHQQQQSDAGDKQQAHQPQLDVSDKQLQSDKLQQEDKQSTQTQLDGNDKKQQQDDIMQQKLQGIRVVAILVQDATDEAAVGETVLKRYNGFKDTNKLVRRWRHSGAALHVSVRRPPVLPEIKVQIANQAKKHPRARAMERRYYSQAVRAAWDDDEFKDEKQAEDFMRKFFKDDSLGRLLLVLSGLSCPEILDGIKRFLCGLGTRSANGDGSSLKFAIALCTNDSDAAKACSSAATAKEPVITYSLVDIYLKRALALLPSSYEDDMSATVRTILEKCSPDEDCMKLVLHALYYNPDMTKTETVDLNDSRSTGDHQERENRFITLCYRTLPNDSKNCLWYSAVFTRGINTPGGVRRASLIRRWIAQGLIAQEDEANHCFDAMVEQKLINSHQVSGMGKVKSCAVHTLVDDLIQSESPTVEDLLLNNQLPIENLELLYSIRIGMRLHPSSSSIKRLFNSMSSKSMLLLRVLDLEGRSDLKPKDLCAICKIRELKYLSLRNTNVAHLPKQIGQLENLETLDIRGTEVLVFHTVLPKLKHLLAGRIIVCQDSDIIKSKESFSTVCIPRAVEAMVKLEVLSRVKVTDAAKELINIGDKLEHLKKLGVVLSGKNASLKDLFLQIEKLSGCLRSLSIQMEPPGNWDAADVILLKPPKLLESLRICRITRGLPPRIKELHHLAKITLRETFLKQDEICVLGMLPKLRCLRLFYHSFGEGTITFGDSGWNRIIRDIEDLMFKNLTDIAIGDDIITSVTLNILPKLEKMTWSFSYMESLSGVQNLRCLTHLVLNGGSYNQEGRKNLERDIDRNRNRNSIEFKITPPQRGEESRVIDPAL